MRFLPLSLVLVCYLTQHVYGFGYITSRYRPEPGYGTWGSLSGYRSAFPQRVSSPREQLLEALLAEEESQPQQCSGRSCSANEHCCQGHICMAFSARTTGTCMAVSNQRAGDECSTDADCDEGMNCDLGVCSELPGDKGYGEDCSASFECDSAKGLCCQMVRRHRQAPRKMCSYYQDPMSCMGKVTTSLQARKRAVPAH